MKYNRNKHKILDLNRIKHCQMYIIWFALFLNNLWITWAWTSCGSIVTLTWLLKLNKIYCASRHIIFSIYFSLVLCSDQVITFKKKIHLTSGKRNQDPELSGNNFTETACRWFVCQSSRRKQFIPIKDWNCIFGP